MEQRPADGGGAADGPGPVAGACRILLVDDHPAIRALVRQVLRGRPEFEVVGEAEDGEAAVRLVEALRPDLVLLDLSLPRMDGLEALSRIKERAPATRVVVFSGLPRERVGALATRLGADEYLEKGVRPPELRAHLARVAGAPAAALPAQPERDELHRRMRQLV